MRRTSNEARCTSSISGLPGDFVCASASASASASVPALDTCKAIAYVSIIISSSRPLNTARSSPYLSHRLELKLQALEDPGLLARGYTYVNGLRIRCFFSSCFVSSMFKSSSPSMCRGDPALASSSLSVLHEREFYACHHDTPPVRHPPWTISRTQKWRIEIRYGLILSDRYSAYISILLHDTLMAVTVNNYCLSSGSRLSNLRTPAISDIG